ncbi:MAG: Hypoxanthine-guanine phosphoribosyltransferase, partial [uncultured Thermomicrobiales bacterium]
AERATGARGGAGADRRADAAGPDRGAGRRARRRVWLGRPADGRGPERGGRLHDRPDAGDDHPARDRLHGRLLLRREHQELRRGPDPQGPQPRHRGAAGARRRGHRRQRLDAPVPARRPPAAQPRRRRRGGAPQEGQGGRGPGPRRPGRLPDPGRVRRRLRSGLRGTLPKPPLRRRFGPRRDRGGL